MSVKGKINKDVTMDTTTLKLRPKGNVVPVTNVTKWTPTLATSSILSTIGDTYLHLLGGDGLCIAMGQLDLTVKANQTLKDAAITFNQNFPTPVPHYTSVGKGGVNTSVYVESTQKGYRYRVAPPILGVWLPQWSRYTKYSVGDWASFGFVPYKCIKATSGVRVSSCWQEAPTYNDTTTYIRGQWVKYGGTYYQCFEVEATGIVPTNTTYWSKTTELVVGSSYAVGDYITYDERYYKCISDVSNFTSFDSSKWELSTNDGKLVGDGNGTLTPTSTLILKGPLCYMAQKG